MKTRLLLPAEDRTAAYLVEAAQAVALHYRGDLSGLRRTAGHNAQQVRARP
jgi:hypothetical protein